MITNCPSFDTFLEALEPLFSLSFYFCFRVVMESLWKFTDAKNLG